MEEPRFDPMTTCISFFNRFQHKDSFLITIRCQNFMSRVNVLPPFKARQVHGIHADGKIFTEPLGRLTCLCSRVGEPRTLQAACLSACHMSWPLLPSVAPIMAPVPLCVSYHHRPQQGVSTCLSARGEQSQQDARTLHNTT